mgnify:CR=1 FL=1
MQLSNQIYNKISSLPLNNECYIFSIYDLKELEGQGIQNFPQVRVVNYHKQRMSLLILALPLHNLHFRAINTFLKPFLLSSITFVHLLKYLQKSVTSSTCNRSMRERERANLVCSNYANDMHEGTKCIQATTLTSTTCQKWTLKHDLSTNNGALPQLHHPNNLGKPQVNVNAPTIPIQKET